VQPDITFTSHGTGLLVFVLMPWLIYTHNICATAAMLAAIAAFSQQCKNTHHNNKANDTSSFGSFHPVLLSFYLVAD
jgi:hypothetical protein